MNKQTVNALMRRGFDQESAETLSGEVYHRRAETTAAGRPTRARGAGFDCRSATC